MRVFKGFTGTDVLRHPVVAIGSFDGVHLGHRRILRFLCEQARRTGGDSVVMTFDPHPQEVLRPGSDFFRINTLEENLARMSEEFVDAVVVIPFTPDFAQTSYREFIERMVIGELHAAAMVMGPSHALGHNREGDQSHIEALCRENNLQVFEIPEFMIQDAAVHSSTIRKLIRAARFEEAERMLGYPYPKPQAR